MSEALCPMPHDEPAQAADGLRLCRGCVRRLRRDIGQHPDLYDELGRRMANLGASNSGPVSGTKDPQINLDPRIVKARDNIVHDLHGWTRIVTEERGLAGPDDERPRVVATWLTNHVDWLAAQPFAEEIARDFRDTSSEAWRLAYPPGRRRIVVGQCVEVGCAGIITAIVAATDELYPSTIVCDLDDAHVWPAREWVKLGRRIHEEGMMSA